jgi:hypothetical protein
MALMKPIEQSCISLSEKEQILMAHHLGFPYGLVQAPFQVPMGIGLTFSWALIAKLKPQKRLGSRTAAVDNN